MLLPSLMLTLFVGTTPTTMQFTVDGLPREALVYAPEKLDSPAPVIFGFHGHGGSMRSASRTFHFHELWPEAIVVYMQGVPTPGRLTDPEGKRNGWQHNQGDHNDRDLKFFDAVLTALKEKYKVDDKRIFASGHSNGGGFTYLLWLSRSDRLAGVVASAAGGRGITKLKPKNAMHIAGRNDPLVKFAGQQLTMNAVRQTLNLTTDAVPWNDKGRKYQTKEGYSWIEVIHDGDHKYPAFAPDLTIRFFKEIKIVDGSIEPTISDSKENKTQAVK